MIRSTKNFLAPNASTPAHIENGTLRMTRRQKLAFAFAIRRILDRVAQTDQGFAIVKTVTNAIDTYPEDRSCWTCDFLAEEEGERPFCHKWDQEPPNDEALEGGCDHHQEDGAPF